MRSRNDAPPYGGLFGGVALPKSESSDASSLALPADDAYSAPPLNLQFGSTFDPSLVQQTRFETGYGDQSGSGFDGVDRSVFSNSSTDLGGSSEENSVLTSKRIEEIRREVGRPDLPVIMLHYITGDALYPRGGDPPR
jgi:hypothetical protein